MVTTLQILGSSAVLTTLLSILLNRYFMKKDKKEDNTQIIINKLSEMTDSIEKNKQNIVTLSFNAKDIDLLKRAMQALARDRMIQIYNIYYEDKKWIPLLVKDSFSTLSSNYHILGDNGVMDDIISKVMSLPTTNPNEDD